MQKYLPMSGLGGANLAGDTAAGGEDVTGVVGGGDKGGCFSMTCNWNASMEIHDSPQTEQNMAGTVLSSGAGDTGRGV